jgi:hypothetical protein
MLIRTSCLKVGEKTVVEGMIIKRSGLYEKLRYLILTDHPRLFYLDPEKEKIRAEIHWTFDMCCIESGDNALVLDMVCVFLL